MNWLWGLLLGLALTFALPTVQMVAETLFQVDPKESLLYASTFLILSLMSVVLFKRTPLPTQREIRLVRERDEGEGT